MIPRTKVNYSLRQLLRALSIPEGSGEHRDRLISLLRSYTGNHNVFLTPSGRAGLYFILKAIDKPRIIIPAYTCNAVVEACLLAGKTVHRVEIESGGFNISVAGLEKTVGSDSAVVATHQFGIPCEIVRIAALCKERGALLVEDAAASLGTRVGGTLTGNFGDVSFFSFDSTKLINVPLKGGFVAVRDGDLFSRILNISRSELEPMPAAHKIRLIAQAIVLLTIENHALYRAFHWMMFQAPGKYTAETEDVAQARTPFYRYDMADWQAYIAAQQMKRIDEIVGVRQARYADYRRRLQGCYGFDLPPEDRAMEWACIRFPIRTRGDKFDFYKKAARKGIDFAFSFTFIACPREFRFAHDLASRLLDLPYYHKLTDAELDRVVEVLKSLHREG